MRCVAFTCYLQSVARGRLFLACWFLGCAANSGCDELIGSEASLPAASVSRPQPARVPHDGWLRLEFDNPQAWWSRLALDDALTRASPDSLAVAATAVLGLPVRVAGRIDLRRSVLLDTGLERGALSWVIALPVDSGAELVADLTLGSRALLRAHKISGGSLFSPNPAAFAWGVAGRYLLIADTARSIEQRGVPLAHFAQRQRAPQPSKNARGTAWIGGSALRAARDFGGGGQVGAELIVPKFLSAIAERSQLRGKLSLAGKQRQIVARFQTPPLAGTDVCQSLNGFLPAGVVGVALDGTGSAPPGADVAGTAIATGGPGAVRHFALRNAQWHELAPELLRPVVYDGSQLNRLIHFWAQVPSLRSVCDDAPQVALAGLSSGVSASLSAQGEVLIQISRALVKNAFGNAVSERSR